MILLTIILLLVVWGASIEVGSAILYVYTRSMGVLEVQERMEIGFSIALLLVLLYVACAISTGELFW